MCLKSPITWIRYVSNSTGLSVPFGRISPLKMGSSRSRRVSEGRKRNVKCTHHSWHFRCRFVLLTSSLLHATHSTVHITTCTPRHPSQLNFPGIEKLSHREFLNWPCSLLNRLQRCIARSHDLSKLGFSSHMWRGARYELSVRINKLDQLEWQVRAYSSTRISLITTFCDRFNQCVVDVTIM